MAQAMVKMIDNLKSSLDRFIEVQNMLSNMLNTYLKSSLDRFIARFFKSFSIFLRHLKSSLDRFIAALATFNHSLLSI